ncbi:hypothetical protein [Coleofasciculus sp.]|uniref:hypothetical protein n=1 Tax=Coleofasciculus sp. TaxID=3100458 RepID=UPI003A430A8D
MIISDLNHLDVISEELNLEGGNLDLLNYDKETILAMADSAASADAIGPISSTFTGTQTGTVAGLFSKSVAVSSSFSAG